MEEKSNEPKKPNPKKPGSDRRQTETQEKFGSRLSDIDRMLSPYWASRLA